MLPASRSEARKTAALATSSGVTKRPSGRLLRNCSRASGLFAPPINSVSIGVSQFDHTHEHPTDLVRAADAALYSAKSSGRNCVILGRPNLPPPSY